MPEIFLHFSFFSKKKSHLWTIKKLFSFLDPLLRTIDHGVKIILFDVTSHDAMILASLACVD